ncbi:UNVERIFIED_CONTAM: TGACG-sequence-specific DNA-binding protein TGA-2.1 [Sesamum radiatum]|uniref:TGACG-sequence-specific DNA-binding protein TGA-2.1 n=1 Tax=Sesamum radiatum TaxID=300843 RepID=A0AAW2LC93_SESRA
MQCNHLGFSDFGVLEQYLGYRWEILLMSVESLVSTNGTISAAFLGSQAVQLQKGSDLNVVMASGAQHENWGESNMADSSSRTDTSTDVDPEDKNQRNEMGQSAAVTVSDSSDKSKEKTLDQKAYVQQLENSRLKLTQLEQELQRARQQGIFISSIGDQANAGSGNGALAFDAEYARWMEENKRINELRTAVIHASDTELHSVVLWITSQHTI